jgi:hypothetical protein
MHEHIDALYARIDALLERASRCIAVAIEQTATFDLPLPDASATPAEAPPASERVTSALQRADILLSARSLRTDARRLCEQAAIVQGQSKTLCFWTCPPRRTGKGS